MATGEFGSAATLRYAEAFADSDDYRLFELGKHVTDALNVGDEVIIKGGGDTPAVLCTPSKTFSIQVIESSNTTLLLPATATGEAVTEGEAEEPGPTVPVFEIATSTSKQYALRETPPRLESVRVKLNRVPYDGPEAEADRVAALIESQATGAGRGGAHADDDADMPESPGSDAGSQTDGDVEDADTEALTLTALRQTTQASDAELLAGLRDSHALLVDGRYRVLSTAYTERVFDMVLALVTENDWKLDAVPRDECVDALTQFPDFVVKHVLGVFGTKLSTAEAAFSLDPKGVLVFRAEQILRAAQGKSWELSMFMSAWTETVPDSWALAPDLEVLNGLVLLETVGKAGTQYVTYFPRHKLSKVPSARFAELFAARPKWLLPDITPFLVDLETEDVKVPDMLLTYTRASLLPDGTTRQYTLR